MNGQHPSTHIIGSIKDTKAEIFFRPQVFRTKADFIRTVQVEAKNPDSMLHKYPADYELFVLADWDEYVGIRTLDTTRLGSVLDLCPLS